jgi:hypothetical protein
MVGYLAHEGGSKRAAVLLDLLRIVREAVRHDNLSVYD